MACGEGSRATSWSTSGGQTVAPAAVAAEETKCVWIVHMEECIVIFLELQQFK